LNSFNAYNYASLQKSFNLDEYEKKYPFKRYPRVFAHRDGLYAFNVQSVLSVLLILIGDTVLDDEEGLDVDSYRSLRNNYFEIVARVYPQYYNAVIPFVSNNTYEVEYTLLVVNEFKYY